MAVLAFGAVTAGTLILGAGRADAQITLVDQESNVDNTGVAVANTGGNIAVGNTSDNTATNNQRARSGAAGDDSVAANSATTGNSSRGTANVHTGDATAVGNHSATTQSQAVHSDTGPKGIVLADQESNVTNAGVGIANTGLNAAVGNASDNTATNNQRARSGAAGDDSVAVNFADAGNHSDGSAGITTGDAWAAGNVSDTYVAQHLWAGDNGGITVVDQDSDVDNAGFALANSGLNLAVGNASDNDVDNDQFALAGPAFGDAVAANFGGTGNWSDGSAFISTGNATAIGNLSATTTCQGVNAAPVCPRAVLPGLPGGPHPAVNPPAPGPVKHHSMVTHHGHSAVGGGHLVRARHGHHHGRTHYGIGGGSLPRTGSPLATQAAFGLLLLALGAATRRRATAS